MQIEQRWGKGVGSLLCQFFFLQRFFPKISRVVPIHVGPATATCPTTAPEFTVVATVLKVRIHGAILRAMAKLHRVSTPKIVARNIAAAEFHPTSATLHATIFLCIHHLQHFVQYCDTSFSVQPIKSHIQI